MRLFSNWLVSCWNLSQRPGKPDVLEHLIVALRALIPDQLTRREKAQPGLKMQRLDEVVLDMSEAGAIPAQCRTPLHFRKV